MMLEIPLSSDPAQTLVTQLGDVKYTINVQFNDRSGVWTLDLIDFITGTELVKSVPLVLGQNLLEPYNFNAGNIGVFDLSASGVDAGPDDLGVRVKVYWYTDDEVA